MVNFTKKEEEAELASLPATADQQHLKSYSSKETKSFKARDEMPLTPPSFTKLGRFRQADEHFITESRAFAAAHHQ